MKKNKIGYLAICLLLVIVSFLIGYNLNCAKNNDCNYIYEQDSVNQISCNVNDTLSVKLYLNDQSNISSFIFKNELKKINRIYGYRADGIRPVLIGKEIDGERDGLYLTFYSSGRLSNKSIYSNGKLDGLSEHYNENGEIIYKAIYENGKEIEILINETENIVFEEE